MTNNLFPNYNFGTARISGAAGVLVYNNDGIHGLTKTGTGIYVFDLGSGADPLEHQVTLGFIGDGAGALTWKSKFLSDQELEVRTFGNGALFDTDFTIEVNRVRTGALPDPPVSPSPPAGSSGQPYRVVFDAFAPGPDVDSAVFGLTVVDANGVPVTSAVILELLIAESPLSSFALASDAFFDVASQGTILDASPTRNALYVATTAAGRFACTLTDYVDESVLVLARATFGSPVMDCSAILTATFTEV